MDSLVTLARQEGFLTTHQALHLGASYRTLHALVARGDLVHPVRSVYLPAQESSSLNREERHAVIVKGLLFAHPGWVASHHSALALSGVPLWDVPADTFHMATVRRASVRRDSLHLHVLQDGDPVGEALGLRVMTPGFAALQVAAAFGVRAGLVAVDACLRTGLTSTQVLQRMVDSGRWRRGLASARRVVELADGRSESAMESVLRLALSDGDWEL
ncbi:MAG: type IV toxin-antitoxin system AbiEi family antitoxin domain-containing protein, partial [Propionibacteriaceae bacterium]|nr:type IV toxin-antitoxin system AbiEi family antitoxin domain-containing protein [Propionibacteriaceae bacterium]